MFHLPALTARINSIRIFHRENNALVDRTSSTNAATNSVCATVSSLSPFVIAIDSPVKQGQLVYIRVPANANVDSTIWAIYPNGTGDHQLTTGSFPRLSPDGNYPAYKRKHSSTTDSSLNYGLWIMNLATGAESEIFYQGDYLVGFDFTPDSSKIIFDHSCSIYQTNLDGSNRVTLDNNCFDDAPVSQPTNGLLAFHGSSGLYASNADGSNKQAIPNTANGDYNPIWSRDGQFLSYAHYDGTSPHPYYNDILYKIKSDGTGKVLLKTLTGTDRFGVNGAWSPDGAKIYMPAIIGGVTGIYAVATDGSGTVSLAPDSANVIVAGANVEFVGGVNGTFVPTAANVSVSGRVTALKGGVKNALVKISGGNLSAPITTRTGSFGYYEFENLQVGETYFVTVSAKQFTFSPNTRLITPNQDVADLNFTAETP